MDIENHTDHDAINWDDFFDRLSLKYGAHETCDDGMCLLEAVAYVAGEAHSDHPACVDPVLGAYGRAVNDFMASDERCLLVPLVRKLIGTACDHTVSLRRAMLLVDGTVRQILPLAFDRISLPDVAATLRDLQPIVDESTASAAERSVNAADSAERSVNAACAACAAVRAACAAVRAACAACAAVRAARRAVHATRSAVHAVRAADSADSAAESAESAESAVRAAVWSAEIAAAWSADRRHIVESLVQIFNAAIELK